MFRGPRWRDEGATPDYRFSLANERTFLAWIRTVLALLAGGVVLEQFAASLQPRTVLVALAVVLCGLAALLSGLAYLRWQSNEIAMRHARPLPATLGIPVLSALMVGVAATITALLLW